MIEFEQVDKGTMASPKLRALLALFLLMIGLSFQGWHLFPDIWLDLSQIRRSIGQSGLWRGANFGQGQRFANYIRFLHESIPPGARVVLPPAGFGPEALSTTPYMQFFLAPRRVINCTDESCLRNLSTRNTYFLIVGLFPLSYPDAPGGQVRMFDGSWGVVAPPDARTGAGPGLEGFQNLFQVLQATLGPVLWLSLLAAAGALLLSALGLNWSLSFKLALGYGAGLNIFSLGITLANLAGLAINPALVWGITAAVFLAALGLLIWIRLRRGWRPTRPALRWPDWSRIDPWPLVFLFLGSLAALIAVGKGYHAADEIQIWGVKGAGIALSQSLSTVTQWGTNTLPYPLLIPISIAAARLLFGEILPASKLIFGGFYLCLLLISYHFLVQVKVRRAIAGVATLLLATAPIFFRHATTGFANLPLAYYLVCGVLLLVLASAISERRSRTALFLLSGLSFVGAAWTRPEGLLMALAAMALLWAMALLPGSKPFSYLETLLLALPLALYFLLWQLINRVAYSQAAAKTGLAGAAMTAFVGGNLHLPELGYILSRFIADLLNLEVWGGLGAGLLLIAAGLAIAVFLRRGVERASLLVLACGLLFALLVVGTYFITSYDPVHDISWWVNSGLDRMSLPALTLLWIGAASLLKFPTREYAQRADQGLQPAKAGPTLPGSPLSPRLAARYLPVAVVLLLLAFVILFIPFRNQFQFDLDEGTNLMKVSMVLRNYRLYEQVWSDQPPLLTLILAGLFRLFGPTVNIARMLILCFSGILLWAAYQFLRLVWGNPHAVAGTLLVFLLPYYMRLSVSIMVGLPSIMFAMLALLAMVAWHQRRQKVWIILSALALSASVLTKLFTGFLAPILVIGLLADEHARVGPKLNLRRLLIPAAIWMGVFSAATLLAMLVLVGPGQLNQLVESHLLGRGMLRSEVSTINSHLRESLPVLLLSLFGIACAVQRRRWLTLYLIAWLGSSYVLLLQHYPVWYHLQLLVTVPAALLAGIAAGEALQWILQTWGTKEASLIRTLGSAFVLLIFTLALVNLALHIRPAPRFGANLNEKPLEISPSLGAVYGLLEKYAPDTRWMITDVPMVPFRLNLQVPPNLVVFSNKRFETDPNAEEELFHTIKTYQPEQILLEKKPAGLEAFLQNDYRNVYFADDLALYIRKDLYSRIQ